MISAIPDTKQGVVATPRHAKPLLEVAGLSLQLAGNPVLRELHLSLPATGITTVIGPSGAGKSSLLRCLNGLTPLWRGEINIEGVSTRQWPGGEDALRRHIGLIAQKPTVFPCSIAHNVIFGIRGRLRRRDNRDLIEDCLKKAALWDEVHERLHHSALSLSVGQQQRLCIARALAVNPRLLLLDEPTASLDPRSKNKIEASLHEMARVLSIMVVTHDMEQVRRLGGNTLFMCDGRLIERGSANELLDSPKRVETREFFQWSVCDCSPGA